MAESPWKMVGRIQKVTEVQVKEVFWVIFVQAVNVGECGG